MSGKLSLIGCCVPDTRLHDCASHVGQFYFVDHSSRLRGNEVVAAPIRVQIGKQNAAGNRLTDAVKA